MRRTQAPRRRRGSVARSNGSRCSLRLSLGPRRAALPDLRICYAFVSTQFATSFEGPLDRLELLERLAAVLAPADRAARRRAEDVLEPRVRRAAVRAAEGLRLQLHERRRAGGAWRRRGEARGAELLAPRGADAVRRPRIVLDHGDGRLRSQLQDLLLERALHRLERGAAEEGRRQLD